MRKFDETREAEAREHALKLKEVEAEREILAQKADLVAERESALKRTHEERAAKLAGDSDAARAALEKERQELGAATAEERKALEAKLQSKEKELANAVEVERKQLE